MGCARGRRAHGSRHHALSWFYLTHTHNHFLFFLLSHCLCTEKGQSITQQLRQIRPYNWTHMKALFTGFHMLYYLSQYSKYSLRYGRRTVAGLEGQVGGARRELLAQAFVQRGLWRPGRASRGIPLQHCSKLRRATSSTPARPPCLTQITCLFSSDSWLPFASPNCPCPHVGRSCLILYAAPRWCMLGQLKSAHEG